jgi:peptide/nickel transport system substrate-binding protein
MRQLDFQHQMNLILSAALSVFLFVSSGCTQKTHDPKETITFALSAHAKSIDPRITTDATGQRLNSLIFNSFVRTDSVTDIKGEAAYKWEYKNKTYTFYMRKGLAFSNGDPVTKEDILFTFAEYLKPANPFKTSFDLIDTVNVNMDSENPTVEIKLKKFSAVFLTDLSLMKILPKKIVEQYGDNFGDHLIGSGAFKVAEKDLGQIVLEAVPNHVIYKPKFKYAVFKIIQDDSTRFLNAYKGAIDIIQYGLPLTKIAYIEKQQKYNVFKYSGSSMNYILLNLKDPAFQNKDFRWALSKALNREEIIKYKLEGYAESATSLLPSNNPFHSNDLKKVEYDPEFAKNTIKKLNLNKEFILKTSNNPEVVEYARVIASQLTQAGLHVKIQSYEWGTFYGDVKSGNYQMAIMRWVGLTDPDIYRLAFHSKEFPPGRNRGYYSNPSLDKMLDEGILIEDVQRRKEHYNAIQKIIFDEQIVIPLWYNALVDIIHKRIEGYVAPVMGDLSPIYEISISDVERNSSK